MSYTLCNISFFPHSESTFVLVVYVVDRIKVIEEPSSEILECKSLFPFSDFIAYSVDPFLESLLSEIWMSCWSTWASNAKSSHSAPHVLGTP